MNCVLAGVGGQGTILASKLIAQAALTRNLPVRTAETIGMAQRGGSVTSHVRVGMNPEDEIASPLVPQGTADILIAFEPGEAVRALPYLKPNGVAIVADTAIIPVTASLGKNDYDPAEHIAYLQDTLKERIVFIYAPDVMAACGNIKALNVALLGAACATGALNISIEEMEAALETCVKPHFMEMNLVALHLGAEAYRASAGRWQA